MLKYPETTIELIEKEITKALSKQDELIYKFSINLAKIKVQVELIKNPKYGDFSTNIMMLFGLELKDVIKFGRQIIAILPKHIFQKVEIVNPGFINMFLSKDLNNDLLIQILKQADKYGNFKTKKDFYNIEFVSANPTGLLHIGHARNAAIGDTLARIWNAYGIKVNREYYINDAGNQIDKLAMSTLVRYKQACDQSASLPEDAYHGNEIVQIANQIKAENGQQYVETPYNDNKILDAKTDIFFKDYAKEYLLNIIKKTLLNFGINIDIWFSESVLYEKKIIDVTLRRLREHTYKKDEALWLKTSLLGDDKDRVLIKSDGAYTYFLPDIAYHNIKCSRGYDKLFDIWGSDHNSYADRMKIAIQFLGYDSQKVEILIMQMVRLVKNGTEFKMSKRSGNSLTLQDLLDTIGKDAARWYLVSQSLSTHLEIDVDRATENNNNNPLYYVQYAHARINQITEKIKGKNNFIIPKNFNLLNTPFEKNIINLLHYFKHTIKTIANNYEIQKMTLYLTNLAKAFHAYYAANKIIDVNNDELSCQRYYLAQIVKIVIKKGLDLIGIKAVDKM